MSMLYFLMALQVADLITTALCLRTGNAHESNPMLAKLFDAFGVVPTLLLAKGGFIALLLWLGEQAHPLAVWALVVLYCWVIYNNIKVLRKATKF